MAGHRRFEHFKFTAHQSETPCSLDYSRYIFSTTSLIVGLDATGNLNQVEDAIANYLVTMLLSSSLR